MNTNSDMRDLMIPNGLSSFGCAAALKIVKLLREHDAMETGGCKVFYSPKEWKARGEQYGCESELVVVYDGGDHASFFNTDLECWNRIEKLAKDLAELGLYVEACTGWYSAIYRI